MILPFLWLFSSWTTSLRFITFITEKKHRLASPSLIQSTNSKWFLFKRCFAPHFLNNVCYFTMCFNFGKIIIFQGRKQTIRARSEKLCWHLEFGQLIEFSLSPSTWGRWEKSGSVEFARMPPFSIRLGYFYYRDHFRVPSYPIVNPQSTYY